MAKGMIHIPPHQESHVFVHLKLVIKKRILPLTVWRPFLGINETKQARGVESDQHLAFYIADVSYS